jgi:hypothetical protein
VPSPALTAPPTPAAPDPTVALGRTARTDTCPLCQGRRQAPFPLCFCCQALVGQLCLPLVPSATMAEYRLGDRLHRSLRGYKDAPVAEARRSAEDHLAGLANHWLDRHGPALRSRLSSGWDAVVPVPSTRRPAGAPVEALARRIPALDAPVQSLLVRGRGPTGHLVAHRRGFRLAAGVDTGRLRALRLLVVDDSLVTGARSQSAAAVLRLGGARVVGVLAIGRAVQDAHQPPGG